jgi:hypothetical protein
LRVQSTLPEITQEVDNLLGAGRAELKQLGEKPPAPGSGESLRTAVALVESWSRLMAIVRRRRRCCRCGFLWVLWFSD